MYYQVVPEQIRQYCHVGEALLFTARYKVVLTTCVNAGTFYALGLSRDHFTHVYVDEAGQATEPECLIPVGLGASGQVRSCYNIVACTFDHFCDELPLSFAIVIIQNITSAKVVWSPSLTWEVKRPISNL